MNSTIPDNLNKRDRISVRISCDAQASFMAGICGHRPSQELPPLPRYHIRKPRH